MFLHIRERAAELEKEIERQRSLELERAKTKELRHNLDMEKERQTQVRSLPPVSQCMTFYELCCGFSCVQFLAMIRPVAPGPNYALEMTF